MTLAKAVIAQKIPTGNASVAKSPSGNTEKRILGKVAVVDEDHDPNLPIESTEKDDLDPNHFPTTRIITTEEDDLGLNRRTRIAPEKSPRRAEKRKKNRLPVENIRVE